jgi:hypothetical protein
VQLVAIGCGFGQLVSGVLRRICIGTYAGLLDQDDGIVAADVGGVDYALEETDRTD